MFKTKLSEAQPCTSNYCIARCLFKTPKLLYSTPGMIAELITVSLPGDKKIETKLNKMKPKILLSDSSCLSNNQLIKIQHPIFMRSSENKEQFMFISDMYVPVYASKIEPHKK